MFMMFKDITHLYELTVTGTFKLFNQQSVLMKAINNSDTH